MEQQQTIESEAYKNFINSINSDITRREYKRNLAYFMTFCKITDYEEMKLFSPSLLEGLIRDYVIHLRHERNLSPATVSSYLAPIAHFYEMNDVMEKTKEIQGKALQHYRR